MQQNLVEFGNLWHIDLERAAKVIYLFNLFLHFLFIEPKEMSLTKRYYKLILFFCSFSSGCMCV